MSSGDTDSFKRLVDSCSVPVVIAGGPKIGSVRQVFGMAKETMDCGAAGVAFGRNVWHGVDPAKTAEALFRIVHGDYRGDPA